MSNFLQHSHQDLVKDLTRTFIYIPFFFFFLFVVKFYCLKLTIITTKNLPPSPPQLPLIGNLHQVGPSLHRSFLSLSQRYGTGPLMLLRLGSVPTLVVSSAAGAREILNTHDLTFATKPEIKMLRRLFYDLKEVAMAPYGERWRQAKKITVSHLLSNTRVQSYHGVLEEEIGHGVNKIKEYHLCKKAVDLSDLLLKLTTDVVCRVTFGRKYGDGEIGRKLKKISMEYNEVMSSLDLEDYVPWLAWIDRMRGLHGRVAMAARECDEFLEGLVAERLAELGLETDVVGEGGETFIHALLKLHKEDANGILADKDVIKALLWDAYLAGTDTTATILEWVMAELLRHPNAMNKVQKEVRTIVNGKQDITKDDIEKMKYLKAVIKETSRIHPPFPVLAPRVATKDVKVMSYDIPKGTRVFVNSWAIARDPQVWEKPEEFCPERFLNSSIDFVNHNFELLTFGAGRRACPGRDFAMDVNESVLASLLCEFDWGLPNGEREGELDMQESLSLAKHRKIHLMAVATPFTTKITQIT